MPSSHLNHWELFLQTWVWFLGKVGRAEEQQESEGQCLGFLGRGSALWACCEALPGSGREADFKLVRTGHLHMPGP